MSEPLPDPVPHALTASVALRQGDTLRELPYRESASIHSDPHRPHAYYGDSAPVTDLDGGTLKDVLALTGPDAAMMCVVQINQLGGAPAKEPPEANAVSHREAGFLVRVLSPLDGTDVDTVRALYREVFGHLAGRTVGRSIGFSFGGGSHGQGLHDAGTQCRLAGLKADLDPANLFGPACADVSPGGR